MKSYFWEWLRLRAQSSLEKETAAIWTGGKFVSIRKNMINTERAKQHTRIKKFLFCHWCVNLFRSICYMCKTVSVMFPQGVHNISTWKAIVGRNIICLYTCALVIIHTIVFRDDCSLPTFDTLTWMLLRKNDFSFRLYMSLISTPEYQSKNIFFSPLSVYGPFLHYL